MQLGETKTRALRVLAAPDRWRRSRAALEWENSHGGGNSSAIDQAGLTRDGFSLGTLDEQTRANLLRDWALLKASPDSGREGPKSTGKVFFEEMLSVADLKRLPAFLETALNESALASIIRGMGMVPHLESVDILASTRKGDKLTASQLWHYDVNDERILKLFVYLEDCFTQNGPFTFISAGRSQQVSGMLGHYVPDDRIAVHVPRDQWQIVEGPAGTAFFIDTGRCYHFGSRCELPRYAYIATYSSGLKFMKRANIWADVLGERAAALSPLQRTVCGI
jgi:hypothetical protein